MPATSVAPGPPGSVTFAFAGDTQFVDVQDTEAGAISTGLPLLADRLKVDPAHVLAPVTPVLVDTYSWVPARITRGIPVPAASAARADLAEWEQRRTCSALSP